MVKRLSFLIHGKVQGVCFRDFTQQKANHYGLTGFVRNTDDGKVQGEVQGEEDDLKKFRKDLNEGPRAAHVTKVEAKEIEVKSGESNFSA